MKCKVLASTRYSEAIQEIQVERNGLIFEPGNCVDILNPVSGIKRPYSIASAPKEDRLLFYARIMPSENGVSQYIANLKKDDEVEIGEAFGYFNPGKKDVDKKYIYVATGTGMAPFRSALIQYPHRPYMILYGVRTFTDMLVTTHGTFELTNIAVSRQKSKFPKHISAYYSKFPIDKPHEYNYYICGLEDMISETTQFLMAHGVEWQKIFVEQFYCKKD